MRVMATSPQHRAQTMHYLRATGIEVALLVNFGHYPQCEQERIVATVGRYRSQNITEITETAGDVAEL